MIVVHNFQVIVHTDGRSWKELKTGACGAGTEEALEKY